MCQEFFLYCRVECESDLRSEAEHRARSDAWSRRTSETQRFLLRLLPSAERSVLSCNCDTRTLAYRSEISTQKTTAYRTSFPSAQQRTPVPTRTNVERPDPCKESAHSHRIAFTIMIIQFPTATLRARRRKPRTAHNNHAKDVSRHLQRRNASECTLLGPQAQYMGCVGRTHTYTWRTVG